MSEINQDNQHRLTPEEELALEAEREAAWQARLAPFRAMRQRVAMSVRANIVAGNITPAQIVDEKGAFPLFKPGMKLEVGDIVRKENGEVWKTIQAHTTQADWSPGPATAALFSRVEKAGAPGEILAWAANVAYKIGDARTHGGFTYDCLQAHTSQVGWEPANVPALWKKR